MSALAHAFAGPLISARASVDRLAERDPDDPDVQQAAAALTRATALLDAVARMAGAARSPQPATVSLDAALRAALRRVALATTPPELQAGSLPPVHADEDQVVDLLAELLMNVAVHVGPGARVRVAGQAADGVVRLTLEDEGPGLPPFVQAGAPVPFRSGAAGHTGCGLAVAAAIARANGGALELEPVPGPAGGLRARISLPRAVGAS